MSDPWVTVRGEALCQYSRIEMRVFRIEEMLGLKIGKGASYREFLRVPALSAGVYQLSPGDEDGQQPHSEDEVYFVLTGHASITVGDETAQVSPGCFLHIPAREPHRFHDIGEDFSVLVVFAPAEGSSASEARARDR